MSGHNAHPVPMGAPMSPAQAAHLLNISRRKIMRAIERHELKAIRDNRNHWKIAPADLDRWAGAQWAPTGHAHPEMPTLPTPDTVVELAALSVENAQLRARLSAAETDRDHWRSMAEKLAAQPKRKWWEWR